ncbi:hypothetical protein BAUCODRAFT_80618 [Baudoinia panamericana UAMH 10762]|uniref:KANL3/Tex30 alpha/beta hydrolase-like domain-containing protein n=1 Tax=Baudoinia panamericana (strain UAMH 10762) TaxID=717646 RepID=M2MYW5_BAUPA|nr:uncharacterized protein BAUCODRAFT_80618 [Baudoinia panamericana UAMH 10762]EMC91490.1 hypothetical protein BAUCODRAFT_80618 [Baudoinia panamericana UAMH 10762]
MKGDYRLNGQEPTTSEVESFQVPFNEKSIICERRGKGKQLSLIFTHGAGGGIANPATKEFAEGFAEISSIATFQGNMNLQSRVKTFNAVADHVDFDKALGGRSMGARAATITAAQEGRKTDALVLVSFPLVGGKKGDSREQILLDLPEHVKVLFITGDKDSQCDLEHLENVTKQMIAPCWSVIVEGADHSMSWKWKDSVQDMRRKTGAVAAEWLKSRQDIQRRRRIRWDEDASAVVLDDKQDVSAAVEQRHENEETQPPPKKRKKSNKRK